MKLELLRSNSNFLVFPYYPFDFLAIYGKVLGFSGFGLISWS